MQCYRLTIQVKIGYMFRLDVPVIGQCQLIQADTYSFTLNCIVSCADYFVDIVTLCRYFEKEMQLTFLFRNT